MSITDAVLGLFKRPDYMANIGTDVAKSIANKISPQSPEPSSDTLKALQTFMSSFQSSAMQAEQAAADKANAFTAQQNELNRLFQQSSAREAMQFEADQAQLNRDFQQSSAREAMQFEADQAQKAMDYQTQMSNTVYQRAVEDLKAAGLNPILAYSNLGTNAPAGVSASGSAASGSAASGKSSSGSSGSGAKANMANAKQADLRAFLDFDSTLIGLGISSASDLMKLILRR